MEISVCRDCGQEIEREESVGWVSILSGDEGGTYDLCEGRPNDLPHRPDPAITKEA